MSHLRTFSNCLDEGMGFQQGQNFIFLLSCSRNLKWPQFSIVLYGAFFVFWRDAGSWSPTGKRKCLSIELWITNLWIQKHQAWKWCNFDSQDQKNIYYYKFVNNILGILLTIFFSPNLISSYKMASNLRTTSLIAKFSKLSCLIFK